MLEEGDQTMPIGTIFSRYILNLQLIPQRVLKLMFRFLMAQALYQRRFGFTVNDLNRTPLGHWSYFNDHIRKRFCNLSCRNTPLLLTLILQIPTHFTLANSGDSQDDDNGSFYR